MAENKPENYFRNVASNYLNAMAMALAALLVTPQLTHHLGVTKYGVWVLIGSLISYFELVELGFANSTVTYVAKHRESGGDDLMQRALNTSFFVLIIPGLFAAGLAVIIAVFLPDIITSIPHDLIGQSRALLLLLALDMVISIPMDSFGGALVSLQKFELLNASLVAVTVLQATGWVIVLLLHGGLVALGVVTVTIGLGGQIARFLMARRLIPGLHISFRAFDRTILRSFLTVTGWFTLDEITTSVIGGVDLVIVGIVVGVREAGIFAVAQRLATIPVQTGYPPAAVAFPYAGQLAGRGDSAGMRLITNRVTRQVMALTVPVALVVMTLSVPAVRAWVGPEFHQSAELAVILCAAVIFHALALAPRAVVSGSGHPKVPTTVGTIEAGTHVVLGVILCRQFGVIGAAYTALACAVFFKCIILVPLLYRRLGLSVLKEYASVLRAHAIPLVIAGALGLYLARNPLLHFVDTHGRAWSIIAVMIAGILVAVLYYAILLFTGTNGPERAGILATVRTRLHLR